MPTQRRTIRYSGAGFSTNRYVTPELVMGWSLWLLASWAINWRIDPPIFLGPDGMAPAVRGLTQSIMLGMGVVWPVWRLSQTNREAAGPRTFMDILSMLLLVQIVLWPMQLMVDWTPRQILAINAVLTVWGMAVALCVWAGWRRPVGRGRAAAMVACMMLLGGGLLLTAISGEIEFARWSPLYMLWMLADPARRVDADIDAMLMRLVIVAVGCVAAWLALLAGPRNRPAG